MPYVIVRKETKEEEKKVYRIEQFEKSQKNMHRLAKIISIIIYIIIVPMIIFNFTLMIKSLLNPNKIPDFFGLKSFIIVSKSMEPTIMVGDAIFVKEVNSEELQVNDIISFQEEEGLVNTHRIIEIVEQDGKTYYRTKGDYNKKQDKQLVTPSKIEGKYQFRIKGFGKITEILKNKVTLVVLLIILVFVSLYQMRLVKRKLIRKEKRYEYNKSLDKSKWL